MQANTRDLAKGHVDHAAHSQLVLVRLTFSHRRGSLPTSRSLIEVFAQFTSKGNVRFGSKADIGTLPPDVRFVPLADIERGSEPPVITFSVGETWSLGP